MIQLKTLLIERIKYVIKGAPKQLVNLATKFGGNAIRLKLIGKDGDTPQFSDVKEVLDYDRYFGPNSRYANGKYVYVISDDLRGSEQKSFYDIATFEISKLPATKDGTNPLSSITAKITLGKSKLITQEDFAKAYPSVSDNVESTFNAASNVTNDPTDDPIKSDKGDKSNTKKSETGIKAQNEEWFKSNGEKYFSDEYNTESNLTLNFYKINKSQTNENAYELLYYFVNDEYDINLKSPLHVKPIPSDMLITDYLQSMYWYNTNNKSKLNQYLTKSQLEQTTDVRGLYKILGITPKIKNKSVSADEKTIEVDGVKISKTDLIENISKIKTDATYLKQFQFLMNQAITKIVSSKPKIKEQDFYKKNWLPFLNAKSKYGQTFGPITSNALREFNKAFYKNQGKTADEIATYTDDKLLDISSDLISSIFDNAIKESVLKLSSILKEMYLMEQDGFDFSENDQIEVKQKQTSQKQKEPVKTDDKKKSDSKKVNRQDNKKEQPKPFSSNNLIRMKNGYITCGNTLDQLLSDEFHEKYSGSELFGRIMTDVGTKKLLYNKNVKVRKGIDALPLSGMQSSFKNTWRGYEEVPHLEALKGTPDPVSWFIRDVKVGSILPLKIKDIKIEIVSGLNRNQKDLIIKSYAWVISSDKKGCWVPTTWIEIV